MVVGDITSGTEVLVVGGGPGGYVAAIRAGQLGLDVTLVEKDTLGGTCLIRGCIPSKALVSGAGLAYTAGNAEEMGISADLSVDYGAMVDWKDGIVQRLSSGVEKLCKANGVTLLEGRAEFTGSNSARVLHEGEGQGAESIEFEHAIIATGSRPIEIPGFSFDDDEILDSDEVLSIREIPEKLVVIGAGYIGMEVSTVFAKLGADVTVIEMLDSVLPGYDEALVEPVRDRGESLGVSFHLNEQAAGWEKQSEGVVVRTEGESGSHAFEAEKVLVAVGREPVTDTMNLSALDVEPTEEGFIETDEQARTSVPHLFAVGDVAGEPMLAHKGSAEGEVAAEVIAGESVALDQQAIPAVVFTDPEIATVGLTAEEARAEGFEPVVGEFPFRASGRAMTTGDTDGFVQLVADSGSGFVLGGQIVGSDASELIGEVGLAIEMGATLVDVASTIHTHPTLSEAVMEAAKNALGQAIHTLNR